MNQATVKFSKEFITPSGLKEWVGIEWPVAPDSDMEGVYKAFNEAKDFVCGWYVGRSDRSGPQQEQGHGPLGAPVINRAHERMLILIENAANSQELEGYRQNVIATDNTEILQAFNKKFDQFLTT